MWLSHHWPEDYDRCVQLGRLDLCRRCLAFYPVWFTAMVAALAGLRWPTAWDGWILWLLPLPVVVEWWLEHLGRVAYSAARSVALSMLCALGVGVAFARYLRHPGDRLFWCGVVAYGVACLLPLLLTRRRMGTAGAGRSGERR